ncbi:CoA pyrophosphatase [Kordiimonas sp. SCSIO 12610]|nr:CoA pyrophosphatase [Kordiimonas sp. SCSIO 12610]
MGEVKPASVLVPVVMHEQPTILLTKRNQTLNKHAGQVSFPGGRIDASDANANAAALRETYEEVGIAEDYISLKGTLDTYYTGTGFKVTPVVGILKPGFTITKQDSEVEEVFEVPLSFILDRGNHKRESAMWKGIRRHYYSIPYNDYYIWGATAAMLVNLVDIMEAVRGR